MTERHLGVVSRFEGWSDLESDLRTGSLWELTDSLGIFGFGAASSLVAPKLDACKLPAKCRGLSLF